MIFGVGAVVAMLSITAGAQKEMMSFIDELGVNTSSSRHTRPPTVMRCNRFRAKSPGLTFRDYRAIRENTAGIEAITPRKRFKATRILPKTALNCRRSSESCPTLSRSIASSW